MYTTVMDEAHELQQVLEAETGSRPDVDTLATQVRRARKLGRIDEMWCSVEMTAYQERLLRQREERTEARIREYFDKLNQETGASVEVRFNGDPRGFPVKVRLPKSRQYNTWGGADDGWGFGVSND